MLQELILKAKILIIDDQRLHIGLLEDILRKSGYVHIKSTTNPQDALELFQEYQPDLILLDLEMPKINGFTIMAQLKEVTGEERLPLLALSPGRSQELKALEAGATDFLTKPYEGIAGLLDALVLHKMKLSIRVLSDCIDCLIFFSLDWTAWLILFFNTIISFLIRSRLG